VVCVGVIWGRGEGGFKRGEEVVKGIVSMRDVRLGNRGWKSITTPKRMYGGVGNVR